MDPNENLKQQREKAQEIIDLLDDGQAEGVRAAVLAANELAELVQALDNWLSMGGFLPAAWADVGRAS